MRLGRTIAQYLVAIVLIAAAANMSARHVGTDDWARMATGFFVLLSVMAAALLVRLARPSPFSNPDVFTDENVGPFFDATKRVATRLAVILGAVGIAVLCFVVAIASVDAGQVSPWAVEYGWVLSSVLGADLAYLTVRMIALVRGDFGFIELQREIVADARQRKRSEAAGKVVASAASWTSPGSYGRLADS